MTLTGLLAAAAVALMFDAPVTVDTNEPQQVRVNSGTGLILVRPELDSGVVVPVSASPLPLTGALTFQEPPQAYDTVLVGFAFTRPSDKRAAERVSFYYREAPTTLDPDSNTIENHKLIRTIDVPAGQEEIIFQHHVNRGWQFSAWAAGNEWKQSCKRISPVF